MPFPLLCSLNDVVVVLNVKYFFRQANLLFGFIPQKADVASEQGQREMEDSKVKFNHRSSSPQKSPDRTLESERAISEA